MPKRCSLPSRFPPDDPGGVLGRRAVLLGDVDDGDAGHEQQRHRAVQRPALPPAADHAPVRVGQRRRDAEDQEQLQQVREGRRVLERVAGVDVEEAAAVRAELLDGLLRGDWTARQVVDRAAQGLQHALRHEHDRADDRDRQQDIEAGADEVLPQVAEDRRVATPGDDASDQRDGDGDARGGRDEVLHGQPGHLAEVGERRLAAVELPVRVGDEGRGGVERQIPRPGVKGLGVEGVDPLRAQDEEEQQPAEEREDDHALGVCLPVLAARRVDPKRAVGQALDGPRDRVQERALAAEDPRHVPAEQRHGGGYEPAVDRDLGEVLEHRPARASPRAGARRPGRGRPAPRRPSRAGSRSSYAVDCLYE
jgi:hypothetical protein